MLIVVLAMVHVPVERNEFMLPCKPRGRLILELALRPSRSALGLPCLS